MTPERWQQIEKMYHSARELGPDVLEGMDPELRRQVELMLAQDSGSKILDTGATGLLEQFRPLAMPDLLGRTVSHYQIRELLGAGGMGVVYKAFDTRLNRLVALKFLPPHLSHDAELKRRLAAEARAASALDHPNIVVIYDIDESGELFIAMAYHAGVTLRDRIAAGLSIPEALDFARQVANGLAKAHQQGIFHRDIKPGNVIVGTDGVARIIDFGLAKSMESTATIDGTAKGTPLYMSPEQASGGIVDFRTDIWSLGAMLYEMLAGQAPFRGDSQFQVMRAVVQQDPAPLRGLRPGLPMSVEAIVTRALRKDKHARYQSAAEMSKDLTAGLTFLRAPEQEKTQRLGNVLLHWIEKCFGK